MTELKGRILAGKILVQPQEAVEKCRRDYHPQLSQGKTTIGNRCESGSGQKRRAHGNKSWGHRILW